MDESDKCLLNLKDKINKMYNVKYGFGLNAKTSSYLISFMCIIITIFIYLLLSYKIIKLSFIYDENDETKFNNKKAFLFSFIIGFLIFLIIRLLYR